MKQDKMIRVAYADDHTLVRKGIISFMEQLGGIEVVIQAVNGKDLIQQLEVMEQLPDAILLDINMPEMDGFETMAIIKERWPDLKVLVLTAFGTEMYIIRMIQLGANGYLLKTCNPEDIKQALVALTKSGYYFGNQISSRFYNKVKSGEIKLPHFTEHEIDFLKYCPTDLTYLQISEQLKTTKKAVESCRDRLFDKLQVNNRTSLAMYAVQFGLYHLYAKMSPDKGVFPGKKS